MDGVIEGRDLKFSDFVSDGARYREFLRRVAPDITDADVLWLHDYKPRLTPIALSVRVAMRARK